MITRTDPFISQSLGPFAYILKHNQRDATLYNVLYCCQCFCMFRAVFLLIITSSKTAYAASLLVPMLHINFWAPDDERKNRSKHAEALTIKNIVQRCISLVVLKNTLAMHDSINVKDQSHTREERLLPSPCVSGRPPARPHVTVRLPLDGYLWYLIFVVFTESCLEEPNLGKAGQKDRVFYIKT
jgi:hypothetical protein